MATTKKVQSKKTKQGSGSLLDKLRLGMTTLAKRIIKRREDFLDRRPHRSFRRTRRRDYVRSLAIPGYFSFTKEVFSALRTNWRTYAGIVIVFTFLNGLFVGISSQQAYADIANLLSDSSANLFEGNLGEIGQSGLLAAAGLVGIFSPQMNEVQQLYAVLLGLMLWLSIVWLLREQLRGAHVKMTDGLYNSGAPIIPTALVFIILTIQLVPLALAIIGISAGTQSGLIEIGVLSMLLWLTAILLGVLSAYWITSTIIALIVITLPGMKPFQAIRTAGDLVIGRRMRILLRLIWLIALVVIVAVAILIPVIVLDRWITSTIPALVWLPIVPVTVTLFSSTALLYSAAYVYLLYRKVVDDDASPA